MKNCQAGILAPVPRHAVFMTFSLYGEADVKRALSVLSEMVDGERTVMGLGQSLIAALNTSVAGLTTFPAMAGKGITIPSTPAALWCWLRGEDRGVLYHRARDIEQALIADLELDEMVEAFEYDIGRDLTGYEDGTENPKGDDAVAAAIVSGQGKGMDGCSYVAVQQWLHDLDTFQENSPQEQDDIIGRRKKDNEELDDAPESAHVKRTAQESFEPEAFILRRSMPWTEDTDAGLYFVAFGRSLDAFNAQLTRMIGAEDGITDALFSFTRPVTGAYFWCPPMKNNTLDLSALGI